MTAGNTGPAAAAKATAEAVWPEGNEADAGMGTCRPGKGESSARCGRGRRTRRLPSRLAVVDATPIAATPRTAARRERPGRSARPAAITRDLGVIGRGGQPAQRRVECGCAGDRHGLVEDPVEAGEVSQQALRVWLLSRWWSIIALLLVLVVWAARSWRGRPKARRRTRYQSTAGATYGAPGVPVARAPAARRAVSCTPRAEAGGVPRRPRPPGWSPRRTRRRRCGTSGS